MEAISKYIKGINRQIEIGEDGEKTLRDYLLELVRALQPDVNFTNEPKAKDYGIPDILLSRNGTQVAYIETKRLDDDDLDGRYHNKSQFDRYKKALDTIVFTNFRSFHLYVHGELADRVDLAELTGRGISLIKGAEEAFVGLVGRLAAASPQRITKAQDLAEVMANKARLIDGTIIRIFEIDTDSQKARDRQLFLQYEAFKRVLISDLTPRMFASIYAQTIVYGLFTARLHSEKGQRFDRSQAATLIPMTNPFLRNVFDEVAGLRMDSRIRWIVDDLIGIFNVVEIDEVMAEYNKKGQHNDPMIHFYEQFLAKYDPQEREQRGVYYTPQPVVGFIVRAVDEILKGCFGIKAGLADYSCVDGGCHRVQILDLATGTGTFLAEVINIIYDRFRNLQGAWQSYVSEHLIDRLYGFEILMASYAIAHLKVDMVLRQTGYRHPKDDERRLNIYLTNSLEKRNPQEKEFFSFALTQEAKEANRIKNGELPIMVIVSNPPYSGESQNGELGKDLLEKYKKEPGSGKNIADTKWLNSDEVKFIALAQAYIERNGGGVIGYINPHTYLRAMTFRGMRWQLLQAFDKIYIVDLHGDTINGETRGTADENVFDIMQGVCINIFVKDGSKHAGSLAEVYYASLYGMRREEKYQFLDSHALSTVNFERLDPVAPFYFFEPKDFTYKKPYDEGFGIDELFMIKGMGMRSCRDRIAYQTSKEKLIRVLRDFRDMTEIDIKEKYHIEKETRDQKIEYAKNNVKNFGIDDKYIKPVTYRMFDKRWTYFTNSSKGFVVYPVYDVMKNLANLDNVALVVSKQCASDWRYAFVSDSINDTNLTASAMKLGGGYTFPLYVYSTDIVGGKEVQIVKPNFNETKLRDIETRLGERIEPLELFDYIYAVLYCPTYRSMFGELLKSGFPRIPYPTDRTFYHRLADKGARLRHLHLMDGEVEMKSDVTFFGDADDDEYMRITRISHEDDRVRINSGQYFGNVTDDDWNFYIGGYQPARRWLQDRQALGVPLSADNVIHYTKIISVLRQTRQAMREIDALLPMSVVGLWQA